MSPSTEEEIRSLIDLLNPKKAIRKLDVKTMVLKFGKVLISDTLSKFSTCLSRKVYIPVA